MGFIPRKQGWFNTDKLTNNTSHQQNEGKNFTVISIDTEKEFDKIWHIFIIKILNKLGIEGTYLNILNREKAEILSFNSCINKRMLPFTTYIQCSTVSPHQSNQARERNKMHPN